MPKKDQRIIINLTCTVCDRRNYTTVKNKDLKDKLKINKFCRWCKKQTKHTEEGVKKKRDKKKKGK